MELHTLGVNGGYAQADVNQVARILTGWSVDRPLRGAGFEFDPNRHEPGTKKVLGQKFKENGETEGRELLHYLVTRPATAQFISRELAVRFVSDDPPQSLVDRMARSYLASGGDIAAVLRTLYHSPEFWSTDVYRAKIKTPIEYVVSAVRASDADIQNLRPPGAGRSCNPDPWRAHARSGIPRSKHCVPEFSEPALARHAARALGAKQKAAGTRRALFRFSRTSVGQLASSRRTRKTMSCSN